MYLKYICLSLQCFVLVVSQSVVQIDSSQQLTPEEIAALERSYEEFVKRNRVQSTGGSGSARSRSASPSEAQRSSTPSRTDIQNDRQLSRAAFIQLGTVNFNQNLPGIIKGDVIPSPSDREANATTTTTVNPFSRSNTGRQRRVKRKAINTLYNVVEKWDNAILHYRVDTASYDNPDALKTKIRSSLTPIEENSCVRFEEILPTQNWPSAQSLVEVEDIGACASVIGRVPGRTQTMSLAPGCHVTGTIQHEFLHALGFGHEHERPDRDSFVAINSRYIQQEYINNFFKEPHPTYSTDVPYDLSSIMHYSQNQFSIDLSANTVELRDPYLAISALDVGQRIRFSWLDEVAINQYYDCKKDCQISCANGGYVRKLSTGVCTCVCPPGLGGATCEEVERSCGQYVDLSSSAEQVVTSQDFDGKTSQNKNDVCYFFIKGPGYIELTFTHFDVTCDNSLEIRSFHISQPALGLCGSTEPAPVRTLLSPNPGMMMLVYDTTRSAAGERGWSVTAKSHIDACLADPCHGAPCTPVPGSSVQYTCKFPDHPMHCNFEEGLLGACNRVVFNKFYQNDGDFQMAWQVSSNNNPHMLTSTDVTNLPQRGVASIVPHDFTGKQWCFSFQYRMTGDDRGTINLYLVKNRQMDNSARVFTVTDDHMSFYETKNIRIDGRQLADSDMVELVFETLYTDDAGGIDTVDIDNLHLIPQDCPPFGDACASFPCGDRDCASVNSASVCTYPDTDIHCGFETAEGGCKADVEYFGNFNRNDNADWTPLSGPTLTPNTGPDAAAVGDGYIYIESNFPPSPGVPSVRTAYLRLAPRRSANRCLSFHYHMFGTEVVRLEVRAAIYDSFVPGIIRLWELNGEQGNQWKFAQVDVNINDRLENVKIQIEIIAKGRSKFSDIAIDDIHLTKGVCNRDPVDGVWTEWTADSDCSTTCGEGTKTRSRVCTPPRNGGNDCVGSPTESTSCQVAVCPVDGVLTDWSAWTTCSATCEGMQTRTRECTPPQGGGQPCPAGELTETQNCGPSACSVNGVWQSWNSWSDCSKSCGTGQRSRERLCTPPQHGGLPCDGDASENEDCNTSPCPVDAVVGEWGQWGDCSKSCGTGERLRERECISEAQHGGATCADQRLSSTEACNTEVCVEDARVSQWTQWSDCSVTCDTGIQNRQRTCEQEAQNGGKMCSEFILFEEQDCNITGCPVDGVLSDWSDWSSCSVTCGDGQQERQRSCLPEQNGGKSCANEKLLDTRPCTVLPDCSTDVTFTPWADWSTCSVTCGDGEQTRTRQCLPVPPVDTECEGALVLQTQSCSTGVACAVDGVWTIWSNWVCSVTCGSGTQTRDRTCDGPLHGGADCTGETQETGECQRANCSIDAIEGNWQTWSACSSSCGTGTRSRTRSCTPAQFGGRECGDLEQIESCVIRCPVNGTPLPWSNWGLCSVTCGIGYRSRTRTCTQPSFGGWPCDVPLIERENCFGILASCEKTYNEWESWGACSQSCGIGGRRSRRRTCFGRALCDGVVITEDRSCNEDLTCPVDGFYRAWGSWSSCSVECGTGVSSRTRDCVPPTGSGSPCSGPSEEERECVISCSVDGVWGEWSNWGQCRVTCDPASMTRTRSCIPPQHGGAPCSGHATEAKDCNNPGCGTNDGFSPWSAWSSCSTSTCSSPEPRATQFRTRQCEINRCPFQPTFDIRQCVPDCNGGGGTIPQTTTTTSTTTTQGGRIDGGWSQWTSWTDCPPTCQGLKTRSRVCDSPPPAFGGSNCVGSSDDAFDCTNDPTCNALISRPKVCEGFEDSTDIRDYGQPLRSSRAFRIQSGPSPTYFSNSQGFGQTGPSWAVEGKNYLLLSTNSPARQDFTFETIFNYESGACMQFKYNTHGVSWQSARLAISLLNTDNGRYSQAMWEQTTTNQQHWHTARFSIPPQQFMFRTAKVVLIVEGGGRLSDLGFDDLQIDSQTCDTHGSVICADAELPSLRNCGFEDGDDCSWIDRNVEGVNNLWRVWRGVPPTSNNGPSSAASGSNYLYVETTPGTVALKSLPAGRGCLQFSYHMIRSRRTGQLIVTSLADNRVLFSQFRNKQNRWKRQQINVNIPATVSSDSHQISIAYVARGSRTQGMAAIDELQYRSGVSC